MTKIRAVETSAERWYAAATLPHKERVALENLNLQSFQAYCPLRKVEVRHARKTRTIHVPVFRGYVFISIDPSAMRWRSINGTRGVRWLVSDKDGPIPIKPGVVETLLASTDEAGLLRFAPMFRQAIRSSLLPGRLLRDSGWWSLWTTAVGFDCCSTCSVALPAS